MSENIQEESVEPRLINDRRRSVGAWFDTNMGIFPDLTSSGSLEATGGE